MESSPASIPPRDLSKQQLHHRARDAFGDGGRRPTSRATTHGRRRLQEQYDVRTTAFSNQEVDEFRQIFEFYDVDNTKTMDIGDLEISLRALGYNPTEKEIDDITALMNVDGDTTLDFSEFCMIIEHLREEKGECGILSDAFRCLDLEENGHVSTGDLIEMMMTRGDNMSLKEVNEMIRLADKQGTGTIKYKDFVEVLNNYESDEEREERTAFRHGPSNPSHVTGSRGGSGRAKFECGKKSAGKVRPDSASNVEMVDTVVKAIGGPILLTSAIIIKATQDPQGSKKKTRKWPSLKNILSLK